MKDRPFEVGFREQASNHPKRHRSKAVVVSVGGKGRGGFKFHNEHPPHLVT